MALKGVIFDYGMVLSEAQDQQALANILGVLNLDEDTFHQHYWRYRYRYDLGEFKGPGFWGNVARDAGLTLSPDDTDRLIENDVLMWSTLNEDMLRWVAALQDAGIRTAILSNMVHELMQYMVQEFGWLGRFDHQTWSCRLGIAKPDPAIYRHTCEQLGLAPEEALFLDDKPENIAAAESVGLHAIRFTTPAALADELEQRGYAADLPPLVLRQRA